MTSNSPAAEKIAHFRRLFGGRTDVFPVRWDNPKCGRSGYAPACANEWVGGVCGKPQVKCGDCPNKKFLSVTPDAIECHLRGEDRVRPNGRGGPFVAGGYPLFFDDACGFLAVDFDGNTRVDDARAFLAACRDVGGLLVLRTTPKGAPRRAVDGAVTASLKQLESNDCNGCHRIRLWSDAIGPVQ